MNPADQKLHDRVVRTRSLFLKAARSFPMRPTHANVVANKARRVSARQRYEAAVAARAVAPFVAEVNAILDVLRDMGTLDPTVNNLRRATHEFLAWQKGVATQEGR